jgi:hypothetical protein
VTEPARDVLPELVKRARQIERLDSEELSALGGIGAGSAAAASRWQVREGLLGREHGGILGPSHFLLTDDDQYRALHAELRELVATNPRGNARLIEQQEAKLRERAVALRAVPAETKERLAYARMTRHADQVSQGIDPFTQQDVRKADTRGAKDFKLSDDVEYREKLDDYMDRLALDPSENAPARGALLSAMEEMAKAWATRKPGREKEKAQELALEASKAHDAKRRHVRVVNTLRHNSDHIVFGDSEQSPLDDGVLWSVRDQMRGLMLNPNVADGGNNNSVDALKEHARELHDAARLRLTEIASMPTDQRVVLRQQRRERNAQLVCDGLFADVPLDGTAVAAAVSPIDDPRYADAVEEYLDLLTNIDVTAEALDAAAAKLFGMAAALVKVPASQRAEAAQVVRTNQLAQNRAAVKRALLQRCGECGILGPAYFEPSDDEAYADSARKILKLAAVDPTGNAQNIKQLIDDLNARLAGFEKWAPEQRRRAADDRRRRYARLVSEGVDPFTRERLSVVSKPNADRSFILSDDAKYRDLLDHLESLITGSPLEASKLIADALAAMQARQAAIKAEATPEQLKLAAKQGAALDAKKLLDRLATTAEHVNRDTLVLGPKYFVPTDSPGYKQMVDELRRLVLLDPNANAGAINELISPLADLATDLMHNCSKTEKQAMVDVRRRANLVALASGREPGNDADLVALHADAEGVVMAPVSDPEFNGALTALMGELQDNSGVINTDAVFDLVAALQQRHADLQTLDANERKAQMAIGHTARKETVQSLVYRCLIPAGLDSLLGPMYFVPTDDDDFKKLHDESKQLAETNPGDENDGRIQQLAQAMAARAVTLAQLPEVAKRTMAAARRRRNADMLRRGIDPTTGKPFALLMARRAFRLTDDPKYEALHSQYHAKVGDPLPADRKAVDGLHGDMKQACGGAPRDARDGQAAHGTARGDAHGHEEARRGRNRRRRAAGGVQADRRRRL